MPPMAPEDRFEFAVVEIVCEAGELEMLKDVADGLMVLGTYCMSI